MSDTKLSMKEWRKITEQSPFEHDWASKADNFEFVRDPEGISIIAFIHHGFYQESADKRKTHQFTVITECKTEVGDSKQLETCKFEADTYEACLDFLLETFEGGE